MYLPGRCSLTSLSVLWCRVEVQWQEREYSSDHDRSPLAGSARRGASCGGGFCIAVGLIPGWLANWQRQLGDFQLHKCHASICFSSYSILNNAHFQLSSPSFPIPERSLLVSCVALGCISRLCSWHARQSWSGGCRIWCELSMPSSSSTDQKKSSAVRSPMACGMR